MARWRLTASHYLRTTDKTYFRYTETDRKTGRPKETNFEVPRLLDVNDPSYWTEIIVPKEEGYINVSDGTNPKPDDIVFIGPPTPDMLPLDDGAKAISAKYVKVWNAPKDGEKSYSESVLDQLTEKLNQTRTTAETPAQGVGEALAAIAKVMEQNQRLMEMMIQGDKARRA